MTLHGIDVSNNQGMIDWPAVAASGVQFAFCKASEGVTFLDQFLVRNLTGAAQAGILPAVYHFSLQAQNKPEAEAQWFLDCAGKHLLPGYPIALDMEQNPYGHADPADCGPWAEAWNAYVLKALNCLPMLYTDLNHIRNRGLNTPTLANSGLWYASPGAVEPPTPAPWTFAALWQHSWSGSMPGIVGNVDLNTFNGDAAAFKRYGLPAAAPVPIPQPQPAPTNDDNVEMIRLVLEPDLPGLVTYAQRFIGA